MQILGWFCLFIYLCSVLELYKRLLQNFLGFIGMDCGKCMRVLNERSEIGCGFLVFGCFSQVFNVLGLFLAFGLGFKVLQFGVHTKCLIQCLCEFLGNSNEFFVGKGILSCKCGSMKFLEDSNSNKNGNCDWKLNSDLDELDDGKDLGLECCDEDNEFDVLALRKLVKIEWKKANAAISDLEKERRAAASAVEEAMAMILRVQSEKSAIEIEANRVSRLAEQKQQYDQEVIHSLLWILKKHESHRSLLEEQLRLCKKNVKQSMKVNDGGDDDDRIGFNSAIEDDGFHDLLISSLEFDELVV